MKTIEIGEASGSLAAYVRESQAEPLVVIENGMPAAVLMSLSDVDLETLSLSTNPQFMALIERARARAKVEGGIPAAEVRRRFASGLEASQ